MDFSKVINRLSSMKQGTIETLNALKLFIECSKAQKETYSIDR